MNRKPLSKVIEIISGGTPKTDVLEYWENGTIGWLSVTDFNNDLRFVYSSEKKITKLGLENSNTKLLSKGDIIISARGTVGALAQLGTPMCFNQSCFGLRGKDGVIDTNYLYYYLKNYVANIKKRSQGSVFDTINLSTFDLMEIEFPEDLQVQQKIASVLSALDSKIELNNRINAELEAMAKTLYDYWFVQFDFPISAAQAASMGKPNLEGKPYKSNGGKMVWNQELKREIPEGWEVKDLYTIANYINGLACQKYRPINEVDEFLPVIKIREMNDGISSNTEKARLDIPEKYIIDDGDVLFSWSATLDVKIWTEGKGALNQHIFKVTSKEFPRYYYYYELLNYLQHFKMMADLRKTTMGHITIDHLKTSKVVIAEKSLVARLDEKITPLHEQIILNKKQNQQLASLRDWLLPMLMNGQVTVGGAPKVYDMPQQQVSMVAEQQALFDSSPIKQAVDLQLAMVLKALNRKKGDTMMQKDAYNLLALNGGKNPFLKAYNYVMNNFGTYSEQLKKDINNNPYIIKHTDGEKSYYWLNPETENEVKKALKAPENQEFVRLINWLKELYAKPFINNNFDRIELMNTVLKIVAEYQTKDPKKVYEVMKTWKVELGKYKTKAQKFTFKETETMLNLMINKGVVK